jgi:hypothetical protein
MAAPRTPVHADGAQAAATPATTRLASPNAERRAQHLVAISFCLLAP